GQVRPADFAEGLGDHAGIVLCQPVFEERIWHTDGDSRTILCQEAGRPKPRVEAVPVDLRLNPRQNLFPEIHLRSEISLSAGLRPAISSVSQGPHAGVGKKAAE